MAFFSDVFRVHGGFCARHPWEVIFVVLTATVGIISSGLHGSSLAHKETIPRNQPLDVVLMTLVRCVAVLYSYHKLRSLHRSHSRFALGLAGIFTVFSSFVFTCSVVNLMHSDLSDLKDALFFFLLLIDVVKACALAHWSLSCSARNAAEVAACIEQGMAVLGPAITLDTAVETLVIGIGTLSGVRRLEVLCSYGCMSALVNYIVFMTFYPACLSLVLELSGKRIDMADDSADKIVGNGIRSKWQQQVKSLKQILAAEQPNPVVQRVKVIMAAGLMVVHARCRLGWSEDEQNGAAATHFVPVQETSPDASVLRLVSLSADQLVLLILVLALTVKFTFFDGRQEEEEDQHRNRNQRRGQHQSKDMNLSGTLTALSDEMCALSTAPRFNGFHDTQQDFFDRQQMSRSRPVRKISVVVGDESDSEPESCTPEKFHREVQTEADSPIPETVEKPASSLVDRETQTSTGLQEITEEAGIPRALDECAAILRKRGGASLNDQEILNLIGCKLVAAHQLEKVAGNPERGVAIRRKLLEPQLSGALNKVPFTRYDYSKVVGACCENVIGYTPVPLGVAGPLLVDGVRYYVPMATTEGCLVASTNRGCRALSTGVTTRLVADGMSRAPVVRLPNISAASDLIEWLNNPENLQLIKTSFNGTSRFAKLQKVRAQIAGRHLFLRFVAKTGDAMGMNMVSKGTEAALQKIQQFFPNMEVVSLSGNFCTDKKSAAVNWLDGRGKSVVCEAVVPRDAVEKVLKTSVAALVDLNVTKNLMGSAMAASIGGFNAHAANIVTAIFIATGQDPAQVVTSSNCITLMEPWGPDGRDLYISCSMPSLEVGTVGGGTGLDSQSACLQMLGVKGSNAENPGENAARLARIVCATVLAGELSLMSALAAGHLVKSHMTHNRSSVLLATQNNH